MICDKVGKRKQSVFRRAPKQRPHREIVVLMLKQGYENNQIYDLIVIGHSLDVTDRDVIVELFSIASSITIMYYDMDDKKAKVENIVKKYEDTGLLNLQTEKKLRLLGMSFLSSVNLPDD